MLYGIIVAVFCIAIVLAPSKGVKPRKKKPKALFPWDSDFYK